MSDAKGSSERRSTTHEKRRRRSDRKRESHVNSYQTDYRPQEEEQPGGSYGEEQSGFGVLPYPSDQQQSVGYPPPSSGQYQQQQPGFYPPPSPNQQSPYPPGGYYPPPQQPGGYQPPPQQQQPQEGFYSPPGQQGGYPPQSTQMQPAPMPQQQQQGPVVQWMPAPTPQGGNVPPGLEYLTYLDQLLVHQVVELLEAFTGWETDNKYVIKNSMGQQCYYAFEESGCCAKMCCHHKREFTMKVVDNTQREVIRCRRECRFCAGDCCWCRCCSCQQDEIVVEAPPGTVVGRVHSICSGWKQTFSVKLGDASNADGGGGSDEEVFRIIGPCCISKPCICMCSDVPFVIESAASGDEVGKLVKQYSGLLKEMLTDADNFSISFPADLDVRLKAVLLGAVFLVDFMYYENRGDDGNKNFEQRNHGMFKI
ncbi:phospholipid scramblase 2-like [Convolutriloba macropyga]|uniref:phospholipid scramblase 2-like n=1 Tax=Convolutriloba macropyga TaxID=536237 RepID=UPI003F51E027